MLGVGLPVALASHYGALDIPRSDDWSYLVTLFRWTDQGRLGFNDWVSMTLIGQLVIMVPIVRVFGESILAVHLASAFIGFVGLVALVWIGRELLPSGRGRAIVAITIAVGPLWGPLASTYMTDVPAFSAQMVAIAFALRAFRERQLSMSHYSAALAFGFVGVSIRQYGAIPLIATVLVALWITIQDRDWSRFRAVLGLVGLTAVACAVLLAWWSSLPDSLSLAPEPPTSSIAANLAVQGGGFFRLTGLLIFPVIAFIGPVRIVARAWATSVRLTGAIGALTTAGLITTYVRAPDVPFVGNYVDRYGVLAEDVLDGNRALVMAPPLFMVMVGVASLTAIVLAIATVPVLTNLATRIRHRTSKLTDPGSMLLTLTVLGFAFAYAFAVATGLPIFDRYALPAIPLVGLLILRSMDLVRAPSDASVGRGTPQPTTPQPTTSRSSRGTLPQQLLPALALAIAAIIGLIFSTDSASFDATRWRVATAATHEGFEPRQINGGFEWVAFYRQRGPRLATTPRESARLHRQFLRGLCVDVIVNPQPKVAARAIVVRRMGGLGHGSIRVVAVPNHTRCAGTARSS